MRIGILGGTFDPIHLGHLYLAEKLLKKLSLDKIIFIPTYLTPHKSNTRLTPAIHRYNMVQLAIGNIRKFEVSDIELKRKGRSYSVDTLRQIRKCYGSSKCKIFFIAGSDSLKDIDKWKDINQILRLCSFVLVERPGFPADKKKKDFIIVRISAKDISASDIRNRVMKETSITRLVPKKVRYYIKKYNLYK